MRKVTKSQLIKALDKLEKNPDSKEKLLGKIGVIGIGSSLGAAAAGSVAAVTGVTSITGITTAASWLGISIVSVTPIGWVVGGAAVGAAVVYGFSKMISSGSYTEGKLNEIKSQIHSQIKEVERLEEEEKISEDDINAFHIFLKQPIKADIIEPTKAQKLIHGVESGRIKLSLAYQLVENIVKAHESKNKESNSISKNPK